MVLEGMLTLSCTDASIKDVLFDAVPNVSEQISASITRVPIVTFRADQAFAFDTGTTSDLSFTIVRTQDRDADDNVTDSRLWTNAKFEEMLVNYIDRWQAETDGCTLIFEPLTSGQSIIHENVYLSNLTIRCDKGVSETLYISLNANIGTMTAQIVPQIPVDAAAKGYMDKIYEKDAAVTMTSSNGLDHYVLYFGLQSEWNCISSYSVKCGPEHPFPVLTLSISKKNLSAVAPNLVEDIIPGKNRIFIHGVGGGEYIVTKTASSGQNYKVTAYSIYEQYRASPVGETLSFGNKSTTRYKKPTELIMRILTDAIHFGTDQNRIFFSLSDIIYCYRTANDSNWITYDSEFSSSADAWYVLNVCALKLGCKIWFADDRVYIVDTSITTLNPGTITWSDGFSFKDFSTLYLNMDLYEPETATQEQIEFAMSVCGETELGDEGSDVLKNYTIVHFNSNNSVTTGTDPSAGSFVKESRNKFGTRRVEYSIPELSADTSGGQTDASIIADNVNARYGDSEQSVCFKLAETHYDDVEARSGKYWQPYFPQLARVGDIYDYSKDLAISNRPNFSYTGSTRLPNKLTLSTVEYFYPQGYAEYWFGIICPVDLTQNTSAINNIVYNG